MPISELTDKLGLQALRSRTVSKLMCNIIIIVMHNYKLNLINILILVIIYVFTFEQIYT